MKNDFKEALTNYIKEHEDEYYMLTNTPSSATNYMTVFNIQDESSTGDTFSHFFISGNEEVVDIEKDSDNDLLITTNLRDYLLIPFDVGVVEV